MLGQNQKELHELQVQLEKAFEKVFENLGDRAKDLSLFSTEDSEKELAHFIKSRALDYDGDIGHSNCDGEWT